MSSEFRERLKAAVASAIVTALLSAVGYGYAQVSAVQLTVVEHSAKIQAVEKNLSEIHTDVREIRRLIEQR